MPCCRRYRSFCHEGEDGPVDGEREGGARSGAEEGEQVADDPAGKVPGVGEAALDADGEAVAEVGEGALRVALYALAGKRDKRKLNEASEGDEFDREREEEEAKGGESRWMVKVCA